MNHLAADYFNWSELSLGDRSLSAAIVIFLIPRAFDPARCYALFVLNDFRMSTTTRRSSGIRKGPAYCHPKQDNATLLAANTFVWMRPEDRIREYQGGYM